MDIAVQCEIDAAWAAQNGLIDNTDEAREQYANELFESRISETEIEMDCL